ncbi:MAG: hypothetical protein ACXW3E_01810 [Thermoanaerobaculia bacterium]
MNKVDCAACHHEIDSAAKVCPYCGSNPATGQKAADTSALLQEMFTPRRMSASESVLEYARHRQGIVIGVSAVVLFLVLAALHQFVTARNQNAVSASAAVPLTEVTDLSNQPADAKPENMPELQFQYDGHPQSMRNFIVESGAVKPPQVVAEEQAAAQAAAAAAAAPKTAAPAPAITPQQHEQTQPQTQTTTQAPPG